MKLKIQKSLLSLVGLASALLLMGASSGGEPQATSVPEVFTSQLVWTPNGKHIFFSRGYQGIFRVDVAGSELQAIPEDVPMGTPSSPGYALPALSPDGTQLAFVAQLGGLVQSTAIMVSALDGTGSHRLTHDAEFNTHPAWSPNGEEIAYIADGKLTVMRADGTNARELVRSVYARAAALAWSPHGSRIAFVGVQNDPEHANAVFTVRPDGTEMTNLGATLSVPSWSPDGSRIAFLIPGDGREVSLYTLDSVGTDPQKVWSLGQTNVRQAWSLVHTGRWFGNLSWSPDGSAILYVSNNGEVEVVSLDYANEMLRFQFGDTADNTPVEELSGGTLVRASGRWAAWSPDGSRIAILSSLYQDGRSVTAHLEELYTMARDGALERVLVQRDDTRLVARHAGWFDTARNIAACAEGFVVPNPEKNPGLVRDCEILMAVRDELAGDFLLDWSPAVPIIEWLGVGVFAIAPEDVPLRVKALSLRGHGPNDDYFSNWILIVTYYWHEQHGLSMPFGLPDEIDIGLKGLSGSIPPELSKLTGLQFLDLGHNRLSGSIPLELGNTASLAHINFSHNNLSGSIPAELAKLSRLVSLDLSHNGLTGIIPPELGKLSDLDLLDLKHNMLSGNIPPELGNLSLRDIDISHNNLGGSIPPELAGVAYMSVRLHGNPLTGCMPRVWKDSGVAFPSGIHDELEFCAE